MKLETALQRFKLAWQQPTGNDKVRPASHNLVAAVERAQQRISALEHALRHASERVTWLGEHHVVTPFAAKECRKIADELWALQSRRNSGE